MEIALALGGGGVRGHAHLGVLRRLDREGFQIKALAGTSAGGLAGAIYAAGNKPDDILAYFKELDQSQMFARRPSDGPSLLGVAGVIQTLDDLIGERTFSDLEFPFAVTAVDIVSGREIVIREGRVAEAVLATIAVPGVFPPQPWNDYSLVDGGVLDPVPVAPVRSLAPTLPIVAVVLTQPPDKLIHTTQPPSLFGPAPFVRQIARLRLAQAIQIFFTSVDISSCALTELKLQMDQPDVIVRPELPPLNSLDPVNPPELATLGEKAMDAALPMLETALSWSNQFRRRIRYGRAVGVSGVDRNA